MCATHHVIHYLQMYLYAITYVRLHIHMYYVEYKSIPIHHTSVYSILLYVRVYMSCNTTTHVLCDVMYYLYIMSYIHLCYV